MMSDELPPQTPADNVIPIAGGRRRKTKPRGDLPPLDLSPEEEDLFRKLIVDVKIDKDTGEATRTIRAVSANVATILQHHPDWAGVVALNTFHLRIEATRIPPWHPLDMPRDAKAGPWGDADTARLANWFARTWICDMKPIGVAAKTIDPAILVAAEANTFHPVRDYLRGLKWDGEPRIDCFAANYLGGELTPYARAVGAAFLIGLVARVMRPGCKLDTMIVLEGKQGKLKSTALEALTSPWFVDSKIPIGNKDAYQQLPGVWLYELGELAAFTKMDVETIKAFMSSRSDHYRPSYGKYTIDVPRQTVFAGSTNAEVYLQDETGGRRFQPLKTGTIKIDDLRRDRDQLFAEALARLDAGAPWWIDDRMGRTEQADRRVPDEWTDRIDLFLKLQARTTVGEILEKLIFADREKDGDLKNSLGKWGQKEQNRVARCLTQLGWTRMQVDRKWGYSRPDAASHDAPGSTSALPDTGADNSP